MSRNAQAAVLLVHRLLKRPRQDRAVDMVRVGKRLAELNMQQVRWPPACCVGRTCPDVRTDCWRSSVSMRIWRKHRLHPGYMIACSPALLCCIMATICTAA